MISIKDLYFIIVFLLFLNASLGIILTAEIMQQKDSTYIQIESRQKEIKNHLELIFQAIKK